VAAPGPRVGQGHLGSERLAPSGRLKRNRRGVERELRLRDARVVLSHKCIQRRVGCGRVFVCQLPDAVGGQRIVEALAQPGIEGAIDHGLPGIVPVAQGEIQEAGEGGGQVTLGEGERAEGVRLSGAVEL